MPGSSEDKGAEVQVDVDLVTGCDWHEAVVQWIGGSVDEQVISQS